MYPRNAGREGTPLGDSHWSALSYRCVHLRLNRSIVSSTVSGWGAALGLGAIGESEGARGPKRQEQIEASERPEHQQLHMGHRRRCPPRRLRPGQVPRRHPAHDGHPPSGRRAGTDQGCGTPHEGPVGRRRHHQPGPSPAPGLRRGLLQHLPLPTTRPHVPRPPTAVAGRLRGVLGRLLAQRPGGPGQVQVPQPDSDPRGSGRLGLPAGKVSRQLHQPQPQAHSERGTLRCVWRAWTTTPWARSSKS